MIEYLFRPSRAGVRSRIWHGRYNLGRGQPIRSLSLDTPDKTVARARLRALVVEKQSEAAGIIAPASQREAAAAPLKKLAEDYIADARARKLSSKRLVTIRQHLDSIFAGTGWKRLADITPARFLEFRNSLRIDPATIKNYQSTANAFLRWLENLGAIAANPLKKIGRVETKGKKDQSARALTLEELRTLMGAAKPYRADAYHFLAYTGMRYNEAKALLWSDVQGLESGRPFVRLLAEDTKDQTKRLIPLHFELNAMLPVFSQPSIVG
jgi:integrase